ncbi:MAG: DNA translocase FtsK [Erythrobacter sp.]|jgi:DNA segregation ATPase FtsK/SpoIIIE-like protein|uniref:DNA translocase FtsK n=1 Tax=Erythrobacter sp. TaxID=1042 RepID=UPI002B4A0F24|nr:DNA translocase FtsK [Erythrobacter sp.]WRH69804.1 MAG: DNA translocase FtsK [Erythrobacter sp.]
MNHRDDDDLYRRACEYIAQGGSPRTSHLMLQFKVGYLQASRWIERMLENGILTPPRDTFH